MQFATESKAKDSVESFINKRQSEKYKRKKKKKKKKEKRTEYLYNVVCLGNMLLCNQLLPFILQRTSSLLERSSYCFFFPCQQFIREAYAILIDVSILKYG
jgi:hypothetical protein